MNDLAGDVLTEFGNLKYSGYQTLPKLRWNPSPLTDTYSNWIRYKKWDFYGVYTKDITLCIVLADLGYIKNAFITIYESGKDPVTYEKLIFPWETVIMSESSESGTSLYESSSFFVNFINNDENTKTILATHGNIEINLKYNKNPGQQGLLYYGPINSENSQFFFGHKLYNFEVDGFIKIGDFQYIFNQEPGVMDWGRGVWPYHSGWKFGSAMGKMNNNRVALNIGELPQDSKNAKATDDFFVFNQKVIKLGVVHINPFENIYEFHTVNDHPFDTFAAVVGKFVPEKKFEKSTDFWLIKSNLLQLFGEFIGEVKTINETFVFNIRGILEIHDSRW